MKKLLSGNEAVARGAWEGGVHFAAAYPGTPSTEILENISKYNEVKSEWSVNEKVALEVSLGASFAGARSFVAQKHVGLNVAADPLFSASYIGATGGFVIVSADDPGMHSSQNEQDNRYYARSARLPMLEPSDSQEAKEFTKIAFKISEQYDTPVLIRLTTRLCHSKSIVELEDREQVKVKGYKKDFRKRVILPANARKRHVAVEERMEKMKEYSDNFEFNKIEWGNTDIGFIASGVAYQYAKEAMPEASFLKISFSYPLPDKLIEEFAKKVKKIIVIEENDPVMETEIKALLDRKEIHGKDMIPRINELNPRIIKKSLGLVKEEKKDIEDNIPPRPPALCPGCPHTGLFYILKKLKVTVTGDIGCYTLGALPPLESMDTCVDMGASVTVAHGLDMALRVVKGEKQKIAAVIGDSTFFHSGITGLIDIVYNKGISTVIIADNRITAMTGHQENPGSGKTIKGEKAKIIELKDIAKAAGVKNVTEVDPYDLDRLEELVKNAVNSEEPSVIITKRPCALLYRKITWSPFKVDPEKCIGCKICVKLGCPALSFRDEKAIIDEYLCVACGQCADVCPVDAILPTDENGKMIKDMWSLKDTEKKQEGGKK